MPSWNIRQGDCIDVMRGMEPESVHCVVTSPPYWGLRDYGVDGAYGLEPTLEEYIAKMVETFREVWRVLRKDGQLWLNLGDAYAGGGRGGGVPGDREPVTARGRSMNTFTIRHGFRLLESNRPTKRQRQIKESIVG